MDEILKKARIFILTNARLLERRLFEVSFEGAPPSSVAKIIRAYQNPDGGLGHALEPDIRCPESQPLFASIGLSALEEAGCRDIDLARDLCGYLQSVSDENGLVPFFRETAYQSPIAGHWINSSLTPGLNPTAEICGLLHYQGIQQEWLSLATETCFEMLVENPPCEAHALYCASRLAEYIPYKPKAVKLLDMIASYLPKASYFIAEAPVCSYGLTPLHFASRPDSPCRPLFSKKQIDGHLNDLSRRQLPDGGWPISWDAPGPASELEWRGRWTLDAIKRLAAYGVI